MNTAATAPLVIVMGTAGSGKSTIGAALAEHLDLRFQDADELHPPRNIEKMSRGIPLTDEDRLPWLLAAGDELRRRQDEGLVMACSALRVAYRDALRSRAPRAFFLHLAVDEDVLAARMVSRGDHFMPLSLLNSQLNTLEPLTSEESGLTIDAGQKVGDIVEQAQTAIRTSTAAGRNRI